MTTLLPTPPIGEPIVWYDRGNKENPKAAQVTGIEDCGKLKIVVHSPQQPASHKAGVLHCSHPIHEQPNNPQTVRCGSWDYVRGIVPKQDLEAHKKQIADREANRLAQQKAFEDAQFAKEAAKEKLQKQLV
jgi:hypothetical protein